MDRGQFQQGPNTPGRYAMHHGSSADAHMRTRSPASVPQQYLRHSSSFGNLHAGVSTDAGPRLAARTPAANPETAALMARVQSVSQKADALLTNAGRSNSQLRGAVAGAYPSERLVDLTERLARLESLLDEVATVGSFRRPETARFENEAMKRSVQFSQAGGARDRSASKATRTLSFPGSDGAGHVIPPIPNVPLISAVPSVPGAAGPTPRSAARFIEVAAPGAATPAMPAPTPPAPPHPSGAYSPAVPMPSFLQRPTGIPWNPGGIPPPTSFGPLNPAEVTPRGGGFGTPRVGARSVGFGNGLVGTPNGEPIRSFSAPRQSVAPVAVVTAPLQHLGPSPISGFSTPGLPPPPGLLIPSLGQILQNSVDAKIRRWLRTIPIGNGADRGWDDSQIKEIADFAQDQHIEHLQAEDIYKKYVEHQVEKAG